VNIPLFPESRPILKDDLPFFRQAFLENPPAISEFTFTNLYAWRKVYDFKVSLLDSLLVLSCRLQGRQAFFVPIGKGDTKEAMERMAANGPVTFIRVPQPIKDLFAGEARFLATEDRNNADYLYLTEDLVGLAGKRYDGKRNLIKKFKAAYSYEYLTLDAERASLCLEFQERWCTIKDCDSQEGLRNERLAIREMIENFADFELIAGAIRIEQEIFAVAIVQELNPRTLVMHVLKADPNIPGLYQTITNEFLSRQAQRFQYVNLEQDLGLEGLRKAKLSYHPAELVMKYTLTAN